MTKPKTVQIHGLQETTRPQNLIPIRPAYACFERTPVYQRPCGVAQSLAWQPYRLGGYRNTGDSRRPKLLIGQIWGNAEAMGTRHALFPPVTIVFFY